MFEAVFEDFEHGVEVGLEGGEAVLLDEGLKAADGEEGSARLGVAVEEGPQVAPLSRGEAAAEKVLAAVAEGSPQAREETEAEAGHLLVALFEAEDIARELHHLIKSLISRH